MIFKETDKYTLMKGDVLECMLEANRAQREIDLHYVKSPYVAKKVTNQITFF